LISPVPAASELAAPVQSSGDLVSLLASLLERVDTAYDLERAIDGVSRLCDRSGDTLRRLEPVAHRARKLLANARTQPFAGMSPRMDIAGLVIAWASGEAPDVPPLTTCPPAVVPVQAPTPRRSVLGFLSYRVLEVAARAARGNRQPLLALPTAPSGAIDPQVLADRRREHLRLHVHAGDADVIQAALRAGEISPSPNLRFAYSCTSKSHTYQGKSYTNVEFAVRVDPALGDEPTLDQVPELFLAALSKRGADYCAVTDTPAGLAEAVRWVATVWPSNREPYYAKGAAELGSNIDWWEARWHTRHFLEPLLFATEPLAKWAGCSSRWDSEPRSAANGHWRLMSWWPPSGMIALMAPRLDRPWPGSTMDGWSRARALPHLWARPRGCRVNTRRPWPPSSNMRWLVYTARRQPISTRWLPP